MIVTLRTGAEIEIRTSDAALAPDEIGQQVNQTATWAREPGGPWIRLRGSIWLASRYAAVADSLEELADALG